MLDENYRLEFIKSNEKLDLGSLIKFLKTEEALTQVNDLIKFFEKIENKNIEEEELFFYTVWSFLSKSGKISKAMDYATKYLDHLFRYKRIPTIKLFLHELKNANFPKKKIDKFQNKLQMILGDKSLENTALFDELFDWHDEHWKTHKESLKRSILSYTKWDLDLVKMIYEFTLKYYFDVEVMEKYKKKILENKKYSKDFINLLKARDINIFHKIENVKKQNEYSIDYDQLAYSLLSQKQQLGQEEQNKVMLSLENMNYEELSSKGQEMLIAFRMLGMHEVVKFLANRLLNFDLEQKEKLSVAYIKAETYAEENDFYGLIKFTEDVIREMEVDEKILLAFYYLCFDTAIRQRKKVKAKSYAEKMKVIDKHYRDVNRRLLEIEKD